MSLQKILRAVLYVLVAAVTVIGFAKIFGSDAISSEVEVMLADEAIQGGTSVLFVLTIVLISLIVAVAFLVSPVVGIVQNPKGFVKSLIGIGVLLVIFFIGYAVAGDGVTRTYEAMGVTTAGQSKLVGGVINTVFILIVLGVLAYIYSSINSVLKQL